MARITRLFIVVALVQPPPLCQVSSLSLGYTGALAQELRQQHDKRAGCLDSDSGISALVQTDLRYVAQRRGRTRENGNNVWQAEGVDRSGDFTMPERMEQLNGQINSLLEMTSSTARTDHSPRVLGIPSWIVATLICIGGSVMIVVGFVFQKKGSRDPEKYYRLGDLVLSPLWFLGVCLTAGTCVCDLIAYGLAPMSLVSPLSGITVALNLVIAPSLLGEKIQPWPDLPATALIMIGTILTTVTGDHEDKQYDAHDLQKLLIDPPFVAFASVLVVGLAGGMSYMKINRQAVEESAKRRVTNPLLAEVLLPSSMAAGMGALANIALKALGELIKAKASVWTILLGLILSCIPAMIQLNYVNRGLQLYMQTIFVPIYSAELLFTNTFFGMIFYKEFSKFITKNDLAAVFLLGIVLVLLGIFFFTYRRPDQLDTPRMLKATKSMEKTEAGTASAGLASRATTSEPRAQMI
eukprot:gnl/TRDRNA2_/TRDRNA2_120792_c0_seq1.p1 gnl/TRDRNA2_/TRDRNA2_120792_c0~~gnl/TRDRNA2_/TRDRNA2_120792_c0_seq1.p1  ORF type:complete len:467 (-),score=66.55 gnl/TRDRNA2_/TRDRNA2_120792_c0_seq1:66-1466(-)